MTQETITQAAIVDEHGTLWTLPRPFRHNHIIGEIARALVYGGAKPFVRHETQGFITSRHRFVGRSVAFGVAVVAGQVPRPAVIGQHDLFSEDVW